MKGSSGKCVDIRVGDFSETPYGRFDSDGKFNGKKFRESILLPVLQDEKVEKVNVYLDTVEEGYEYGSSFFEEAFGGLVRVHRLKAKDVLEKLNIVTVHGDYVLEIKDYISGA